MDEMKSNPILKYVIRPVVGKGLWQDRASFLFFLAALVVFGYLIFAMLSSPFYFQKLGSMHPEQEVMGLRDLPELQPIDVYSQIIDAHPIFGTAKQETVVSKSPCDDFGQTFSLSGIVQGGQNEAIFVNKRTRQTHFVTAGNDLEGVSIQLIQNHSVIIRCAGDEKEILIEET